MQHLLTWARWTATIIVIGVVLPIAASIAIKFLEEMGMFERPGEAGVRATDLLFSLADVPSLRATVFILVGFAAGLWLDCLLRRLENSRTEVRKNLGSEMVSLAHSARRVGNDWTYVGQYLNPKVVSTFIKAAKFGLWVPNRWNELGPERGLGFLLNYLSVVGAMLEEGELHQAKQVALSVKHSFDESIAAKPRAKR
jgi:hypothetical protein